MRIKGLNLGDMSLSVFLRMHTGHDVRDLGLCASTDVTLRPVGAEKSEDAHGPPATKPRTAHLSFRRASEARQEESLFAIRVDLMALSLSLTRAAAVPREKILDNPLFFFA
jgi:hypothetical protein